MTDTEILEGLNRLAWEGFTVDVRVLTVPLAFRGEREPRAEDLPAFVFARARRNEIPPLPTEEELESSDLPPLLVQQLREYYETFPQVPDHLEHKANTAREALIKLLEEAEAENYI